MKINDGSVCADCEYFDHECDFDSCFENCKHSNETIRENFDNASWDDELIEKCEGFEAE